MNIELCVGLDLTGKPLIVVSSHDQRLVSNKIV